LALGILLEFFVYRAGEQFSYNLFVEQKFWCSYYLLSEILDLLICLAFAFIPYMLILIFRGNCAKPVLIWCLGGLSFYHMYRMIKSKILYYITSLSVVYTELSLITNSAVNQWSNNWFCFFVVVVVIIIKAMDRGSLTSARFSWSWQVKLRLWRSQSAMGTKKRRN
jgi:hypothetical protein